MFEKIDYPWFRPEFLDIEGVREFTSEDVGFCLAARRAGFTVHINPRVIVGHEKMVVLRPLRRAYQGCRKRNRGPHTPASKHIGQKVGA